MEKLGKTLGDTGVILGRFVIAKALTGTSAISQFECHSILLSTFHLNQQCLPSPTCTDLWLEGVSEYLEDLVARVDALTATYSVST